MKKIFAIEMCIRDRCCTNLFKLHFTRQNGPVCCIRGRFVPFAHNSPGNRGYFLCDTLFVIILLGCLCDQLIHSSVSHERTVSGGSMVCRVE